MKDRSEILQYSEGVLDQLKQDISKIEKQNQNYRNIFESDASMEKLLTGLEGNEEATEDLKDLATKFEIFIENLKNS